MPDRLTWSPRLGLAVGLAAAAASGWSLRSAALEHVPLSVLFGPMYPLLWAALIAAAALVAAALLCELRTWRRRNSLDGTRSWLPLRALFSAMVLGAAAFIAVFPSYERLWFDLALGPLAGTLGSALLLARRGSRWVRGLDFVLFQLALVLTATEAGLRTVARIAPAPILSQASTGPWQRLNSKLLEPGSLWWGHRTNSEGHYDQEFGARGDRPLVASIGDSFSVGVVPIEYHFTSVAERALAEADLRVDNYGAPSIGPLEYRDLIRFTAVPRRPDLIVVNLFVGNDLKVKPAALDRAGSPLQVWLDRGNALTLQVPLRMARLGGRTSERTFRMQPKVPLETPEQTAAALPWLTDPTLEPATFELRPFLKLESDRARDLCITAELEPMRAALREMQQLAGEIPLAVMLIPDEFQVEDALWATLQAESPPLLEADRDRPQRLLVPILEQLDIPHLDLLPALRAVPPGPDGKRHVYHLQDTHFNARGNEVAGRALAAFIAAELKLN